MSSVGGSTASSVGGPNMGRMFVQLKPRAERTLGVNQVDRRAAAQAVAVSRVCASIMQNPPAIRIGGRSPRGCTNTRCKGPIRASCTRRAQTLEREMAALPELQDVTSDLQLKNPQVNVAIDRDKAAAVRVTRAPSKTHSTARTARNWISTIYSPINQYHVLLELKPEYQAQPDAVSLLYLKSQDGQRVPLDTVTRSDHGDVGPQTINHFGQLPAVTISFNLKPGVSLGDAVASVEDLAARRLAGDHQRHLPGHRQGVPELADQSLGCCWSSPSRWCTSCWACCTRATSTR